MKHFLKLTLNYQEKFVGGTLWFFKMQFGNQSFYGGVFARMRVLESVLCNICTLQQLPSICEL
jgi:hypothetical protein